MGGQGVQVVIGGRFTATLDDPGHVTRLGARVEVPVTHAVVAAWQTATLVDGLWSVTLDAPVDAGFYNLVWRTVEDPPAFEASIPLQAVTALDSEPLWPLAEDNRDEVSPAVDDVARLIRTRTVAAGGGEVGTFDETTRPTVAEADELIDQAVDDVLAQLRVAFDPAYYPQVKRAVTFYAAMLIERSFYPEAGGQEGSALPWQPEYREAVASVGAKIEADNMIGSRPMESILS